VEDNEIYHDKSLRAVVGPISELKQTMTDLPYGAYTNSKSDNPAGLDPLYGAPEEEDEDSNWDEDSADSARTAVPYVPRIYESIDY